MVNRLATKDCCTWRRKESLQKNSHACAAKHLQHELQEGSAHREPGQHGQIAGATLEVRAEDAANPTLTEKSHQHRRVLCALSGLQTSQVGAAELQEQHPATRPRTESEHDCGDRHIRQSLRSPHTDQHRLGSDDLLPLPTRHSADAGRSPVEEKQLPTD